MKPFLEEMVADLLVIRELTDIEQGIIRGILEGLTNEETARRLRLKTGTVRNYVSLILRKTGLRHRTQIAVWAVQNESLLNMKNNLHLDGNGQKNNIFCNH
jgi:DNA-binding NarL/FixJ family response regulator